MNSDKSAIHETPEAATSSRPPINYRKHLSDAGALLLRGATATAGFVCMAALLTAGILAAAGPADDAAFVATITIGGLALGMIIRMIATGDEDQGRTHLEVPVLASLLAMGLAALTLAAVGHGPVEPAVTGYTFGAVWCILALADRRRRKVQNQPKTDLVIEEGTIIRTSTT